MSVYIVSAEIPPIIENSSYVIFYMSDGSIVKYRVVARYSIKDKEYWAFMSCVIPDISSNHIFRVLNINADAFASKVLGYNPKVGSFPYVRLKDLRTLIEALMKYRPSSVNTNPASEEAEEKFTLRVKKHKPINLNFNL